MNKGTYNYKDNGDIFGKRDLDWIWYNIILSKTWAEKIDNKQLDTLDVGSGSGRLNPILSLYSDTITNIEPFIIPHKQFVFEKVDWHTKFFEEFIKENTKKFDLITFFLSFYLMKNKENVLKVCKNILNNEGIILIVESIYEVTMQERYGYYSLFLLEDFCRRYDMNYSIEYTKQEPKSTICLLEK